MNIAKFLRNFQARNKGWKGERPLLPFFKNHKKCHSDSVHLWVKISIQNVVLRVSRRKNSKIFPCGTFFFKFLTKCLSKWPNSPKLPLLWKISDCTPDSPLHSWYHVISVWDFDWNKLVTDEINGWNEIWILNKIKNWISCTKLDLSAIWFPGLIAQSVERI